MDAVPATKIGLELLEAFGLESQGVKSIVIRVAVGEAVSVLIEKYIGLDQVEGCINTLKSYELAEKEAVPT